MTKGRVAKKRKKKESGEMPDAETASAVSVPSESESDSSAALPADLYAPYMVPGYVRQYPEDVCHFEYVVFLESVELNKPIGDRDMMSLANILKRYNKGIKQLLLKSETIMNMLIEAIVKIITLNKTAENPICSQSIKDVLFETISTNKEH